MLNMRVFFIYTGSSFKMQTQPDYALHIYKYNYFVRLNARK